MAKGTVNKVILVGRLGQDPERRTTAGGAAVCTLSIATTEPTGKNPDGTRIYGAEWHRVVMFGKMAENADAYLKKGSQVYIEGRLRTRKWTDQQGIDRYTTEIQADEMQFLTARNDGPGNNQPYQPPQQAAPQQAAATQNQGFTKPGPPLPDPNAPQQPGTAAADNEFFDDIPF